MIDPFCTLQGMEEVQLYLHYFLLATCLIVRPITVSLSAEGSKEMSFISKLC